MFVSSLLVLIKLLDRPGDQRIVVSNLFRYFHTAGVNVDMGIYVDPLSVFMALVVSGVSFLIHVYSVSYMTSDRGYARYFGQLLPARSTIQAAGLPKGALVEIDVIATVTD